MEASKIWACLFTLIITVIVILENSSYYITYGLVVPDLSIKHCIFGSCLDGGCRRPVNEEVDRTCFFSLTKNFIENFERNVLNE